MTDVDDFLEHYGVKGMKWGVRKAAGAGKSIGSSLKKVGYAASGGVKDAVRKSRERRAETKAERAANFEKARNSGYSSRMRNQDLQDVGLRGTRRIEARIAKGERVGVARFKESVATTARGFAVGTAILATPVAIGMASKGLSSLANDINAKRGAEVARNLFADNKGLTSYQTVALAYDSVTKSFK